MAVGVAAVVVGAPAVLAVAVGAAAFSAATVASAALVVAGGGAIGAGIGLALAPDGCEECQKSALIKGAISGASAALSVMMAGVGAIGGLGRGALAFASGGVAGGGTISAGAAANAVIGASAATAATVVMMSGAGKGEGHSPKEDGSDK